MDRLVPVGGLTHYLKFGIHAVVTVAVVALLATINLLTVPEFLWFLFPMAGMSVGLAAHYLIGHWLPARRARQTGQI